MYTIKEKLILLKGVLAEVHRRLSSSPSQEIEEIRFLIEEELNYPTSSDFHNMEQLRLRILKKDNHG
jgi:hypothetical protein